MEDSGFDSDSKSNGEKHRDSEDFVGKFDSFSGEPHDCISNERYLELYSNETNETSSREEELTKEPLLESLGNSTTPEIVLIKPDNASIQLQKRLEKHIQEGKKIRQHLTRNVVETQPRKFLIPRNRLAVPVKTPGCAIKADEQPLVSWESDSDDEFEYSPISKASSDITQQLIKDGYNLDSIPDDEDLDLIPLKPLSQRCPCCHYSSACVIQ